MLIQSVKDNSGYGEQVKVKPLPKIRCRLFSVHISLEKYLHILIEFLFRFFKAEYSPKFSRGSIYINQV